MKMPVCILNFLALFTIPVIFFLLTIKMLRGARLEEIILFFLAWIFTAIVLYKILNHFSPKIKTEKKQQ